MNAHHGRARRRRRHSDYYSPFTHTLLRGLEPEQYVSLAFGKGARDAGIAVSLGSCSDAYNNAVAESFFAKLEKELVNRPQLAQRGRAAVRRVRVHREVIQPSAPPLNALNARPSSLRTTPIPYARRLRAIARTTTINPPRGVTQTGQVHVEG